MKKEYDVIIVGGGPAGLTAAIYTGRKKLKTLIVTAVVGGQTILTNHIENYPGFDLVAGPELISKFERQAEKFGADLVINEVNKIIKKGKGFEVCLRTKERYHAKSVIIASGKIARKLGIPGEEEFLGKGVSTCATCDSAFFKDKVVAVVGGGNSGFEAAELLNKFAKKVYLIHRSETFRADEITVKKVKSLKNVEIVTNTIVKKINGTKFVESIDIENVVDKKKKNLQVDGIFIEIGYMLDTNWLKGFVKRNKYGEIIIDSRNRTSREGIFAAGDVSNIIFKQTVISAGEGAKAGLEAYKYVKHEEKVVDWH